MARYYIDTCIWRDYLENREDRFRPLGQWALFLFQMIEKNNEKILYSELVIRELCLEHKHEKVIASLQAFSPILVSITDKQLQEAEILGRVRKVGGADALHAILARDNNAILVTRDAHYIDMTDIATIKKPEDLI